jgi:hypothetical protein
LSFWTKTLRPIAKVVVRAVAAVYTGGASEALLAGIGQSGLGISDLLPPQAQEAVEDAKATGNVLLEQAARRYPNVALLASQYREVRGQMREPEPAPDYGEPEPEEFEEE